MTVLYVERHYPHPERRAGFEQRVVGLVEGMRTGALWVDAAWSFTDPDVVSILSEWRSDRDLDAFLGDDAYTRLATDLDPHVREAPTIRRFRSL